LEQHKGRLSLALTALLTDVVGRLNVLDPETNLLSQMIVDVSRNGEFRWLWNHIQRTNDDVPPFVLDVGAYDGVMASNSFNFLTLSGWQGLLVEADEGNCRTAKANLKFVHERGLAPPVNFHCGAIGRVDERVELVDWGDLRESRSLAGSRYGNNSEENLKGATSRKMIDVSSIPTFIESEYVPRAVGVLSIDVEAATIDVLEGFMAAGLDFRYLILEVIAPKNSNRNVIEMRHYVDSLLVNEQTRKRNCWRIAYIGFNAIFQCELRLPVSERNKRLIPLRQNDNTA